MTEELRDLIAYAAPILAPFIAGIGLISWLFYMRQRNRPEWHELDEPDHETTIETRARKAHD
jgi:hypothetical protein